jgi:hypothetical protein
MMGGIRYPYRVTSLFPHPTRYRLFQRGSTFHVTPCHDDVSDTESTDIVEVLPNGYQVIILLETLLWLSVGQDSHLPIQTVHHVIHIPDFSTPHRLDTYTPTVLLRLTGFMGSPSTADSKLRYWKPTLITTSDLLMSKLTSVSLTWNRCVCGVMGHTPLPHPFYKWEDRYE